MPPPGATEESLAAAVAYLQAVLHITRLEADNLLAAASTDAALLAALQLVCSREGEESLEYEESESSDGYESGEEIEIVSRECVRIITNGVPFVNLPVFRVVDGAKDDMVGHDRSSQSRPAPPLHQVLPVEFLDGSTAVDSDSISLRDKLKDMQRLDMGRVATFPGIIGSFWVWIAWPILWALFKTGWFLATPIRAAFPSTFQGHQRLRPNPAYEAAQPNASLYRFYSTVYTSHACLNIDNATAREAFQFMSKLENAKKYQKATIDVKVAEGSVSDYGLGAMYDVHSYVAYGAVPAKAGTGTQHGKCWVSAFSEPELTYTLSSHAVVFNNYYQYKFEANGQNACTMFVTIGCSFRYKILCTLLRICFGRGHGQRVVDNGLTSYLKEVSAAFKYSLHCDLPSPLDGDESEAARVGR